MKNNAVIPYAIIAAVGILLVIVLSTAGVFQRVGIEQEEEGDTNTEEQDNDENGEEGETEDPEAIFENNCMQCHGEDLEGANGPELDNVGGRLSKDEIQQTIMQGTDGGMPGGLVSDDKAEILADWLSDME